MPKYQVETDQGTYEVELDREPESQEQLQSLLQAQLGAPRPIGEQVRQQVGAEAPLEQRLSAARQLIEKRSPTPSTPEDLPRERLTIGGELTGGLGRIGRGLYKTVTDPLQLPRAIGTLASEPSLENLLALTETGPLEAVIGGAQTVSAPLAPVSNLAQDVGVAAQKGLQELGFETAADVAGGVISAAADVLAPSAIAKGARLVKPRFREKFLSNRQKAERIGEQLEAGRKEFGQRAEFLEAKKAALQREAGEVSKELVPKTPSKAEVQQRIAPGAPLGEQAGKEFVENFNTKFNESKARFEELYRPLEEEGAKLQTAASNYQKAGGTISAETGVTRPFGTPAESIAKRIKARLRGEDVEDAVAQRVAQLETELRTATSSGESLLAEQKLKEFIGEADIPAQPTVADLIRERRRLKAGWRATQNDNQRRQLNGLIEGLEEDIAVANPQLASELFSVDAQYAKTHAPYFAKGAIPRKIAEGDVAGVVDSIFQRTVSGTGVTLKNDAVETMRLAKELMPANQWPRLERAFLNKGIEAASPNGVLDPKRLASWWNSFKDPAGTGNKVLDLGVNKSTQREMGSVIEQLQRVKVKPATEVAEDLARRFVPAIEGQQAAVKLAAKQFETEMSRQISELMGAPTSYAGGQFIGQLFMTEGVMELLGGNARLAGGKFARGAGLLLSRYGLQGLLNFSRGRSLLKAALRATPGTAQAAANARQIMNFIRGLEEAGEIPTNE